MKIESLLKMGHQHCVGYSSGGVTVPYPTQNAFGCGVGVRVPQQTNPRSIKQGPKGNNGSRHDALITHTRGVSPLQMKAYDHDGSRSGMSDPLMHH